MAQSTVRPETTLRLTRTFRAPRDTVFQAWTDPEELTRWWGPPGYATPVVELELRVVHERFPAREARDQHEAGWTASLDKLATVLAGRS